MQSEALSLPSSKSGVLAGRIISTLVVLFLIFDGGAKVLKIPQVVEGSVQLGVPESAIPGIGIILLVATLVYVLPRTAVLGAILLTGYLGGAVFTHVRVGGPLFPIVFAVAFGVLTWLGLYL
ncbi:MAG: DoxX family protein, partial [bacterium]